MLISKTFGQNVFLLIISITAPILLLEWVVGKMILPPAASIALKQGVDFDVRSRLEVILDCRKRGKLCYPAVPPNTFLSERLEVDGEQILPLSGVAHARIIACNEGGFYSTYTTDEYGFRNPAGIWRNSDVIDLAFVGDSYTQGDCVNDGDHFIDHFRSMYPKVINLGAGGNGPLLELASVREYLEGKRVRYLFWIYFERNDFSDLSNRKQLPVLLRYLESGFSQSLIDRHKEIDKALRVYVDNRLIMKEQGRAKVLPNLRQLLWKLRNETLPIADGEKKSSSNVAGYDIELFKRILEETQRILNGKRGQLVFVYLPEYERFRNDLPSPPWSAAGIKSDVLSMVSALGIDVIDIEPAFHRENEPLDLFPFGINGHYNSKGYAVVANEIKKYLDAH